MTIKRLMPMSDAYFEPGGAAPANPSHPIDDATSQKTQKLAVTGGLLGALAASSCCILPLLLVSLGLGGAWLSKLTALSPYQPIFIAAALAALGAGFWQSYRKQAVCLPGSFCESKTATRTTKVILWLGSLIVAAALSANFLAPYLI